VGLSVRLGGGACSAFALSFCLCVGAGRSVLAGVPGRASTEDPWPYLMGMQPGSVRAQAVCEALKRGPEDLEQGHWSRLLEIAYAVFREELGLYTGEAARNVAEAMYLAAPAPWSSLCLEGVARRTGDLERSAQVLELGMATETDPVTQLELRERRSIVAAGAGERAVELDWLGRALVLGGSDGLQMRARIALGQGARERSTTLFRILVDRNRGPLPTLAAPPAWALRGWGLALLPVGPESSVPLDRATH